MSICDWLPVCIGAMPVSVTAPGCAVLTTTTLSAWRNLTPSTDTVPEPGATANCTPPLPVVWYLTNGLFSTAALMYYGQLTNGLFSTAALITIR